MAAIENDDFILCLRRVGEPHHVRKSEPVVARCAVTSAEITAGIFDVAVTGEVEQRDICVVRE